MPAVPPSSGRVRAIAIGVGLVAAAAAVVGALGVAHGGARGQTAPQALATIIAGLAFALAGSFALLRRAGIRTGTLLTLAGFLLLATSMQLSNQALPFTIGWVATALPAAVIAHLLLSFPDGRLHSPSERLAVALVYVDAIVLQAAMLMFMGFTDVQGCPCPANLLLIRDDPMVHNLLMSSQQRLGIALVAWVVWLIVRRWWLGSPPLRRTIAPLLLAGAVCGVLFGLALIAGNSSARAAVDLNAAERVALVTVPVAFLFGLVNARLARASVGDLMLDLESGGAPGRLRESLARALGDPSLQVAYWLPDSGSYADVDGQSLDVADRPGRAATVLKRRGSRLAVLLHDPALNLNPELLDSVAAAAGLELENEGLQAELRAQLEQLRASRARIVEAGDQARRKLERNLHDGAQQRLVALALVLSLAQEQVRTDPAAAADLLESARAELASAVEELRELARGLHPAILNRGLQPALTALVERCPVPVDLDVAIPMTLPLSVAATGYYVVAEALTNVARYSHASVVRVRVHADGDTLRIEVTDDGVGGAAIGAGSGLEGLRDRVEAIAGSLELDSPAGSGTRLAVYLPCG
jgi:signal transduction histidine kinase